MKAEQLEAEYKESLARTGAKDMRSNAVAAWKNAQAKASCNNGQQKSYLQAKNGAQAAPPPVIGAPQRTIRSLQGQGGVRPPQQHQQQQQQQQQQHAHEQRPMKKPLPELII